MDLEYWMRRAVEQARAGIASGQTPFGAVIVRGRELIAGGHNQVWKTTDPTAHAEMVVIRRAAADLGIIDLSGHVMFTTCEPCPMCAAAIHWAKLDAVYCGATIEDARRAGFSELALPAAEVYRQGESRVKAVTGVLSAECAGLFEEWRKRPDRKAY